MKRENAVTFKAKPIHLIGPELKAGDKAPDFTVLNGLDAVTLGQTAGKPRLFSVVPSLDTGVCNQQTHRFDTEIAALGDKVAAYTFSLDLPFAQKRFCTAEAITQLGKGEALVSVLDPKGVPTMVERTMIRPPSSRMGPITPEERQKLIRNSPVYGDYEQAEDRESAYEILTRRAEERAEAAEREQAEKAARIEERRQQASAPRTSSRESATDRFVKNLAGTAGRQIGNMIIRGILGGLKR